MVKILSRKMLKTGKSCAAMLVFGYFLLILSAYCPSIRLASILPIVLFFCTKRRIQYNIGKKLSLGLQDFRGII